MNKSVANGLGIAALLYLSSASATSLYDVKVSLDGSADYASIQQAIDSAPDNNQPFVIYIKNGIYQEKLHITRPNIYLIGEDRDKTIITATTANSMKDENGKNFGTFGSRTVSVDAVDFKARSLTIENGFDFPANQAKAVDDPTRQKGTQAVALLVSHNGDKAQFKDVNLVSYQDTLYLRAGRSYFDQSQVSGKAEGGEAATAAAGALGAAGARASGGRVWNGWLRIRKGWRRIFGRGVETLESVKEGLGKSSEGLGKS